MYLDTIEKMDAPVGVLLKRLRTLLDGRITDTKDRGLAP